MAKPQKGKGRTKAKSTRRALNAFEIASRAESHRNGSDSDSDSDGAIVNPRKNLTDGGDADEKFEDEELDSDEALGSDDDFDVLNSKFSQTLRDKAKSKKKGNADFDEEEESDGEMSVDENEFVSLTEAWDMDEADKKKHRGKDNDVVLADSESESESESESDDEDSEDEDEDEDFPFSDEENADSEEEPNLTNLKNSLIKKQKRERKHYQNLNVEENELALPGGGNEISLADMLSVVDGSTSKNAILINKEDDEDKNAPLAIPLPQRIQARNERKAAYQITKEEVDKWKDVIKTNREKEVLTFDNGEKKLSTGSTFVNSEKPFNELEAKINSMLKDSALLDEKKESTFEEIATAKMSQEELRKRQTELRKMRELMFRQEREAKRIKKIKSKSYRKIKKREMMKNKALIEGEESDDEDHDMRRAEERMSLKHKNNSAWAKSMIKSGLSRDADAREEMEEMLRRGEKLKAKIVDRDGEDDEFGDTKDLDLDRDDHHESDTEETRAKIGKTGVLNMTFMKNAEARERTRNEEMKSNLRKLNSDEDLEAFEEAEANAVEKNINSGRRVYSAAAQASSSSLKEINDQVREDHEVDESTSLKSRLTKHNTNKSNAKQNKEGKQNQEDPEHNPWLMEDTTSVQKSRKLKVVDEKSSKLSKAQAKIEKSQRKRKASEMAGKDDDDDEVIDMNQTLKIVDKHGSDDEVDHEEDESQIKMFKQTDLIKQAFAGDDVVREFEEEKRQRVKDEGDQVEDLTLPGWGGWAGGNAKKTKRNKIVKKTKGTTFQDRKDKFKDNVIINEKVNKKNAKYQSSAVPFPFESREQYERSLRMPIGQEWTSRETHQRLTMPRVIVKTGSVINPLKAPFK